ncbi:type II toxin-antitoxin system RelE/ParE family toxin [Saccharopolyspora hirsuta]|uniref:type II toxin-antitoxin system RelE/ParE family toxin n=1 Tax=Saccharopolyspora hirsuta TaxID=1837 RepID=UPI00319DE612
MADSPASRGGQVAQRSEQPRPEELSRRTCRTDRVGTPRTRTWASAGRHVKREHRPELEGAQARLPGRSEIRILFVFDPHRQAVLLVAGDKAGEWNKWYRRNIALAEERYLEYLRTVEGDKL